MSVNLWGESIDDVVDIAPEAELTSSSTEER